MIDAQKKSLINDPRYIYLDQIRWKKKYIYIYELCLEDVGTNQIAYMFIANKAVVYL